MKALFIISVFCLAVIFNVSGQATPQEMLNKAIYEEEVNGNLEEAIELFLEIVDNNSTSRTVAVEAFYHLGLTNEKLGNKKAKEYYEKIVNSFGDQPEFVRIAKERLSRLILIAEKISETPLVPKFTKIKIPTELSWAVKLSPDGKDLALVSDKKLWKMPLSGNLGSNYPGVPVQINTEGFEVDWSGLSWSKDGKWIAFNERPFKSNEENKRIRGIFIVPTKGGKPKKITETYRGELVVNYRLSLSPDGKNLAYSSVEGNKKHIYTISSQGGNPKLLSETESREPVYSPDGKMIAFVGKYPEGNDGKFGLWSISTLNGTAHHLADAGNASSPVWSPDGKMIAFLDYSNEMQINLVPISKDGKAIGKITSIDAPEGTEEVRLLAGWTPDNKIGVLLVAQTEFALYTLPAKGGQAAKILNDTYAIQPRFSNDGKKIYYTTEVEANNQSWEEMGLAVVSAEGGKGTILPRKKDTMIIVPYVYQAGNRVSPDGKMIISRAKLPNDSNFIKNSPSTQIWKIPMDGSKATQISKPAPQYNDLSPSWSPDGNEVAFVRRKLKKETEPYDEASIFIVDSLGMESEVVSSLSDKYILSSVWSPNGEMIAYFTKEEKAPNKSYLNTVNVENGKTRIVGEVQYVSVNVELAWSPDNKRIAFNDEIGGKVIKIMNLDDGSIEDIYTGLVDITIHHLDWSPDGERFVFGGMKGGEAEFWLLEDFLPKEESVNKQK